MTDFNSMSLSQIEKHVNRAKAKAIKTLARLDSALTVLKPAEPKNGKSVTIHSITEAPKARAKAPNKTRVLQGRYMGAVRYLTVAQKKKVKAVKEKHGFVKAIKLAKSLSA